MTLTHKTLHLPRRGLQLEYVEHGRPRAGAPSLLMLHGITDSWRSFAPVLPHLPPDMHAIALTQRGHGGSSKPVSGYASADFAADVADTIAALDLHDVVLIGHSMGAFNALRVALDAPQRLRALVLMGAFAGFSDKPEFAAWVAEAIVPLQDPVPHALAESFQRDTLAQPMAPEQLETFVQESLRVPARIWRSAFAGLLDDGWMARIGQIALPTWLVWGEADVFVPRADCDRLLAQLRQARLTVYADTGHALHWDRPQRCADDLARFVETL